MKKLNILFTILAASVLFFACNGNAPQEEEPEEKPAPTYTITAPEGLESTITIDETKKTITLAPSTEEVEYTITGTFEGQIINKTKNTVIVLKNANLKNTEGKSAIAGELKTEIKAAKDTENTITVTGSGDAPAVFVDKKNLEIGGSGKLTITCANGHAVKADEVKLKGSGTFVFDGGADSSGINCNNFVVKVKEGENPPSFTATIKDSKNGIKADETIIIASGTFRFENIKKIALKTDLTPENPESQPEETIYHYIEINGGAFTFKNCKNVYETDSKYTDKNGVEHDGFTKADSVTTWTIEK